MKGWYVFSGKAVSVAKKRVEYVFFDDETPATPVAIKPAVWDTFKRLYSKPSKHEPEPDGSWKVMINVVWRDAESYTGGVEAEACALHRRVPIFYVGDLTGQGSDDFAFGLTRLFKVPHKRTVGETLPGGNGDKSHDPNNRFKLTPDGQVYLPDFVDMLFGYVEEPRNAAGHQDPALSIAPGAGARKGRIAFSFAHIEPGSVKLAESFPIVQMAPRASFGPFYLEDAGKGTDREYSAVAPPRIAGRKRYLPRHRIGTAQDKILGDIRKLAGEGLNPENEKVRSTLQMLLPADGATEIVFRSTIRLHNVTAAEIGAVLFALTHGGDPRKPCRHMLGRAKPLGAGQLRVNSAMLRVQPNDAGGEAMRKLPAKGEIASPDGLEGFCPAQPSDAERNASHRPFLKAFVDYIEKIHPIKLSKDKTILEFLAACSPETGTKEAADGCLSYMPLLEFKRVREDDVAGRSRPKKLLPLPLAPELKRVWETSTE